MLPGKTELGNLLPRQLVTQATCFLGELAQGEMLLAETEQAKCSLAIIYTCLCLPKVTNYLEMLPSLNFLIGF